MKNKRSLVLFAVMTLLAVVCMLFANRIQTDGGKIRIEEGYLESDLGDLYYKLYIPETATAASPAPGVLLLHGYQNDHETCAAYAIELARRGVVVMALDEYGHGWSRVGLSNRGFVNHKVTVNYGNDSEADGTYVSIGGAGRYRLMMNFSNLSFFNDHYSADSDGNRITDSSCGGVFAYAVLADYDFVDSKALGISGHSMGTWSSWTVAAAYSGTEIEPKATVLQCGELFTDDCYDTEKYHFNNVLLLQAKYDEFSYFRDYENTVNDEMIHSEIRAQFLGTTKAKAYWNRQYGTFADGSARKIQLLYTNHRLTTHNKTGLATALDWFQKALGFKTALEPTDQVAMVKETLVLAAMLLVIFAMLPLMDLLTATKLFSGAIQELPSSESILPAKKRLSSALITVLLAGITYPFMTQLGHGLLPLPEKVFRMTIGNGFLSYYGLLIVIMLVMDLIAASKAKKSGSTSYRFDTGLGTSENGSKLSLSLLLRGLSLAAALFAYMYVCVFAFEKAFHLDLRFIWPFFKSFTGERAVQFLVYYPLYALYFVLSSSKVMASLKNENTLRKGTGPFLKDWCKNALVMTGGVLLIVLVEYIPFFAEIGPGADLLFGSTFGGPFMSLMILFLPQVLIFSVLSTYSYRKTGSVYTGGLLSAALACWIVTGGSSML